MGNDNLINWKNLFYVALLFVFFACQQTNENQISNTFNINGQNHNINLALQSVSGVTGLITFASGNITHNPSNQNLNGTGNHMDLVIAVPTGTTEIPEGTFPFEGPNSPNYNVVNSCTLLMDYTIDQPGSESAKYIVNSGNLSVSKNGNTYTVNADFYTQSGDTLILTYQGVLTYL